MDISGINSAAARANSTALTQPQQAEKAKAADTQEGNNITEPSPNEQRADNLRATSNQQVPASNADTESSSSDSATKKPVVSDNINQALVQQALARESAASNSNSTDNSKKDENSNKKDDSSNKNADSIKADEAASSKEKNQAVDQAKQDQAKERQESNAKGADGGSKERPQF